MWKIYGFGPRIYDSREKIYDRWLKTTAQTFVYFEPYILRLTLVCYYSRQQNFVTEMTIHQTQTEHIQDVNLPRIRTLDKLLSGKAELIQTE